MDPHADAIGRHYAVGDLLTRIEAALDLAGKDRDKLVARDLAPVDAYHVRGRAASEELSGLVEITADTRVLDLGSGLGGSARFLAEQFGCQVMGLDVTPEYCRVANTLSDWVGLGERTRFEAGSALAMPFADDAFDLVWCEHVQMNIQDKTGLYAEVARVLKPGGRFAFHEIYSVNGQQPDFPVPWSEKGELSFLATADAARTDLEAAGFESTVWRDTTAPTVAWYEAVSARLAASGPPTVGLHLLMGESTLPKMHNLGGSLRDGKIEAWQGVFSIA